MYVIVYMFIAGYNYVSTSTCTVFLPHSQRPSPNARCIDWLPTLHAASPDIARLPMASQGVAREAGGYQWEGDAMSMAVTTISNNYAPK